MNELKVFSSSEFGELGVMLIDGREYFPATRCARILGYKEPAKAIREHCKGVSEIDTPTNGGVQSVKYISEGNLYRLIVSSKLPAAEKFERWVFDEVLPGIRKNGGYGSQAGLSSTEIEKLITATAAEVVSKVVPAVVSEVVKIMAAEESHPSVPCTLMSEIEDTREGLTSFRKKRVIEKPDRSKIAKLPPDIKAMVENMLIRGSTFIEISTFITNVSGISVSTSSICRYRERNFEVRKGN